MTNARRTVFMLVVLGCMVGLYSWKQSAIARLERETAVLREQTAQLEALRAENERLARTQTDPEELQRLRADQSELLRLRNEMTRLRRQLADATARRGAPTKETPLASPADPAAPPVQIFTANVGTTVALKQTLAMGGWATKPGTRTLFFIQPEIDDAAAQAGHILLKGRFLEMPDEILAQVGLDGLKTENTLTSSHVILTPEQADALTKTLEQTPGVEVLSAPRVQTGSGVQARVAVTNTKTTASGEKYELGPSVEIVPVISADRGSVSLTISAQLRLPSTPAR
jgi:hypothetical protein